MKKLNELDLKILRRLTVNARVPLRNVAEGENSSRSSVNQRLQRMIENGIITGLKYHVSPKMLGYNTCTFVGVRLERGSLYKEVAALLERIPEIVECHYTTGPYTLLIKLYATDNNDLMRILNGTIQEIPGVTATETLISLDVSFERSIHIPTQPPQSSETRWRIARTSAPSASASSSARCDAASSTPTRHATGYVLR